LAISGLYKFPDKIFEAIDTEKDRPLLIVGRAGTGKTTLIREILSNRNVRQVVLAPTGIAALQAGGQTIHSFFKIPPGLNDLRDLPPIYGRQASLIKSIDRMIIDEISMMRADLLDTVDFTLRRTRKRDSPFGGIQVIMVGDFFQLPPVVGNDERDSFGKLYENRYIFSSKIIQEIEPKIIELTKVFRQRDEKFIEILGNIREGRNIFESIAFLNKMCVRDHDSGEVPLLLTAYNITADTYNLSKLMELPGELCEYMGKIEGDFNIAKNKLPSPELLQLKVGARVMMTKNDTQLRWVNGSLGTVEELTSDSILIRIDHSTQICDVNKCKWERNVYTFDQSENRIEKKIIGRYIQFPIQLAWASTIHKAQGLTLNDVRLDLSTRNFECGQTYVALSRATSLDGLSFTHPLSEEDIIVDHNLSKLISAKRMRSVSFEN
jgi:ATP-dependent exoDNAse (exonuclease V) alpha subunit